MVGVLPVVFNWRPSGLPAEGNPTLFALYLRGQVGSAWCAPKNVERPGAAGGGHRHGWLRRDAAGGPPSPDPRQDSLSEAAAQGGAAASRPRDLPPMWCSDARRQPLTRRGSAS